MRKQKGICNQGNAPSTQGWQKETGSVVIYIPEPLCMVFEKKKLNTFGLSETDSSDLGRAMHFLVFIKIVVIHVPSPLFWGPIKTLWPTSVSAYRHLCLLAEVQFLNFERGPFTESPRGSIQVHTLWSPNLPACTHSYKMLSFILSHREWFKNTRHKFFSVLDIWVQSKSKNYTHVSNVNHHREQGL